MLNNVTLHGRLTRDPEGTHTKNNTFVCKFSIAVNSSYKKDHTNFFNCTAFGKTGETIINHMRKGSEIIVQGELDQQRWQDENQQNRSSIQINVNRFDFCGSKQDGANGGNTGANSAGNGNTGSNQFQNINPDDVPFG